MTGHGIKAPATLTIGTLAAMAVIGLAALSAALTVVTATRTCSDDGVEPAPSGAAEHAVPAEYLRLYRLAAHGSGVPWPVLAAIGSIETDHGRSHAPGVRAGLNRHGCCAGPMQFNTRDGPPSTWRRYGVDANHDGATDIHDPEDAIPSAAAYLSELARRAHGNLNDAILGYNHSPAYNLTRVCPVLLAAGKFDVELHRDRRPVVDVHPRRPRASTRVRARRR